MKKTMLVLRHELVTTLRRPSYLLLAFGIPLLAILIFAGYTVIKSDSAGDQDAAPESETSELEVEGYVDQSGLIRVIPQSVPPGHLVAYAGEELAQQATWWPTPARSWPSRRLSLARLPPTISSPKTIWRRTRYSTSIQTPAP